MCAMLLDDTKFTTSVTDSLITLSVQRGHFLGSVELSKIDARFVVDSFDGFDGTECDYCWFYFNRLFVAQPIRNLGIATTLLTKLIVILDDKRINVVCDINPYGDLNLRQLRMFYCKYGFIDTDLETTLIRKFK